MPIIILADEHRESLLKDILALVGATGMFKFLDYIFTQSITGLLIEQLLRDYALAANFSGIIILIVKIAFVMILSLKQ